MLASKFNSAMFEKQNALMGLLFDNAYIPRWLFTSKEHFVESKGMLFHMCSK